MFEKISIKYKKHTQAKYLICRRHLLTDAIILPMDDDFFNEEWLTEDVANYKLDHFNSKLRVKVINDPKLLFEGIYEVFEYI